MKQILISIYNWIVSHIDILGLTLDLLAFFATIILTIVIYKLERRHEINREKAEMKFQEERERAEKEAEKARKKAEEDAKKAAIFEAAKVFLIDNEEEIEYLTLAEIAANLKLKRKHNRTIITKYLRCSKELQKEILLQANIPKMEFSMDDVDNALEALTEDLEKNEFGRNILYDNAKYLHRAFERYADVSIENVNPHIFEDVELSEDHGNWRVGYYKAPLSSYMWSYLNAEKIHIKKDRLSPPIDMVFHVCHMADCEEKEMTFWTMRVVIDACCALKKLYPHDFLRDIALTTQEEMYYYTLAILWQTYCERGDADDKT